jgi:hypothetical protein
MCVCERGVCGVRDVRALSLPTAYADTRCLPPTPRESKPASSGRRALRAVVSVFALLLSVCVFFARGKAQSKST